MFKSKPKPIPGEAPRTEPAGPLVPPKEDKPIIGLPWMAVANKELGVKEIFGSKDNPRVIEYHSATSLSADDDETAWCASFASWVLRESGMKSPKTARARDFLKYGEKLESPKYGCIVVYDRGNNQGHVHFYEHEDGSKIYGIGGNQNNSVCVSGYDKSRVLGYRWPQK